MPRPDVLAIIVAGGAGSRLGALTDERAKPSLPFGGSHRLIDFPLSNCRHSRLPDVWVVEQHNPQSLIEHLANGRPWDLDRTHGGFRLLHPFATEGEEEQWHEGNAHALHVHRRLIEERDPTHVLVLSADHVYRFDYRDLIDDHVASGAGLTVLTTTVDDPERYGLVDVERGTVSAFDYKPDEPSGSIATTEVFLYSTPTLLEALRFVVDEHGEDGLGDFGEHLVPMLVEQGEVQALPVGGYWRDLGLIESYWQGHLDLLGSDPVLSLDDPDQPLLGRLAYRPPARLTPDADVTDSMVSPGAVIEGTVRRSIIGPGVHVAAGSVVDSSVLMDDVIVGAGATVHTAVLADRCELGAGCTVGDGVEVTVAGVHTVVPAGGEWLERS